MPNPNHVDGGYFIMARRIMESDMMDAPPLLWKLWIWMLGQANWKDRGKLRRGQLMTTICAMREAMSWRVGYRKEMPSKDQIRSAYEALAKATMITTARTTRGLIITILNYDRYQTPENYEAHAEPHNETLMNPERPPHYMEEGERKKNITTPPLSANGLQPVGLSPASEKGRGDGVLPVHSSSLQGPLPPQQPPAFSIEFLQFLDAYGEDPNDGAWSAWGAVCKRRDFPGLNPLLAHLNEWQDSDQWTKESGQFRPSAENYLRKGYWQRRPPKPVDPYDDGWVPPEERQTA